VEYFRPGHTHLDRDNVGLIAVFADGGDEKSEGGRPVIVANTHVLFNPKRGAYPRTFPLRGALGWTCIVRLASN
jgi:hypothetical protein